MPRYFFHTRDDDKVITDEDGVELPDLEAVKRLASKSLAELALEVLPRSERRCLGVDVADEHQRPVLTTELTFEARILG